MTEFLCTIRWYFPFRDGPDEGPAEAGKEKCNRIVASWTAMQHIDRENGCLFVKVSRAQMQTVWLLRLQAVQPIAERWT